MVPFSTATQARLAPLPRRSATPATRERGGARELDEPAGVTWVRALGLEPPEEKTWVTSRTLNQGPPPERKQPEDRQRPELDTSDRRRERQPSTAVWVLAPSPIAGWRRGAGRQRGGCAAARSGKRAKRAVVGRRTMQVGERPSKVTPPPVAQAAAPTPDPRSVSGTRGAGEPGPAKALPGRRLQKAGCGLRPGRSHAAAAAFPSARG